MKAAILKKYSRKSINVEIIDIKKPDITDDDVLIKVKTAAVNPLDNMIINGKLKIILPYKLPIILGNEVVGIIEEKGKNVKDFEIGDRIFSRVPIKNIGTFSEYCVINKDSIAKVPEYLTDEEAVAIPISALTFFQAMELLKIEENKSIFISGATGSFGKIAIPLAKEKGLKVYVNGNSLYKDSVLKLGADKFIDYKTEDYTKILKDVDYVIDTIGGKEIYRQMKILKKYGRIVSIKGMPDIKFAEKFCLEKWKKYLFYFLGSGINRKAKFNNNEYNFVFVKENGNQLKEISKIFEKLKIRPEIGEIYEFKDIKKAIEKVKIGNKRGKIIIKMGEKGS